MSAKTPKIVLLDRVALLGALNTTKSILPLRIQKAEFRSIRIVLNFWELEKSPILTREVAVEFLPSLFVNKHEQPGNCRDKLVCPKPFGVLEHYLISLAPAVLVLLTSVSRK
jgi:hypothetical protein